MRIAYFDCSAGAAGDMIVGALIDAGAPLDALRAELAKLELTGYSLAAERVVKQGFAATKFSVLSTETGQHIDHTEDHGPPCDHDHPHPHPHGHEHKGESGHDHDHPHPHPHGQAGPAHSHGGRSHQHGHSGPHRHLGEIARIIEHAAIAPRARQRAVAIFTRLAEAEGKAHGLPADQVHFHEVGAVDAIVDIVGACVAVELLGIERVIVSPLPPGSGVVRCAHGLMPVPTPATAELLRGVPLAANRNPGELLTPTGAAVLVTLADAFADAPPPGARIAAVGVGAGNRDGANAPNVLRAILCDDAADDAGPSDRVTLIETNLDDLDGQSIGRCFELLLAAGALDVWATPIVMKKNRPAYKLSVLCPAGQPAELDCRRVLLTHTSTFGVRQTSWTRTTLDRAHVTVQTAFGPIRVKVGRLGGQVVQAQPEYEDCRAAAEQSGQPLLQVRQAALDAYRRG